MAAPTVAVTVKTSAFIGTAIEGATVKIKLNQFDVYQQFVAADEVTGTTDEDGECVLDLFPNALPTNDPAGLGSTGSVYNVTISGTGFKKVTAQAVIPNQACDLHDVLVAEEPGAPSTGEIVGAVRYNIAQTLSAPQQAQARANIGFDAAVRAVALTGLSLATATAIAATDTTLVAFGKAQAQITAAALVNVTLTATQTLTNKTLTSPAINTAALIGGTIDNAIIGATTRAAASVTTLSATGQISTSAGLSSTRNIAYSGALAASNAGIFFDGNASGSSSNILTPLNLIRINSDTVSVGVGGIVDAFHVYHNFGGAGCVGGRSGTQTTLVLTAATDSTTAGEKQYVVDLQIGVAQAPDGGTGTTSTLARGALYGSNPNVRLAAAATNWYGLFGTEVNVAAQTGSSVAHKCGVVVVATSSDNVQGTETDSAIVIANQIGAVGWNKGISFGRADGVWPVNSTGTLIGTNTQIYDTIQPMTAGNGVDFSAVTFSTSAFKSNGFNVDGSGAVTAASFTGPLTGNVTGNVSGSSGSTTGNAATATALATARAINGVNFDGTAAITVTAAAATLTGTTLNSTVVTSSLTSVGALTSLTVSGTITAGTLHASTTNFVNIGNASNGTSFKVSDGGVSVSNLWVAYGAAAGARPTLRATSTTAVSANIQNGAAAPIILSTDGDGTAAEQLRINHTAGTTNYITITGSNGANPTLSTNAGDLAVGTGLIGAAYAEMTSYFKAHKNTAMPAGGTAGAGYRLFSTTNFGLFGGSGAPTLSAAKGSLYLRSDGSTTNDRAYINTDGGTTWTALTTAA